MQKSSHAETSPRTYFGACSISNSSIFIFNPFFFISSLIPDSNLSAPSSILLYETIPPPPVGFILYPLFSLTSAFSDIVLCSENFIPQEQDQFEVNCLQAQLLQDFLLTSCC